MEWLRDITFDDTGLTRLRWLLVAAGAAALFLYGMARRRQALEAFVDAGLLNVLAPDLSRARQWFKAALTVAATALIALALIGPRWGDYWEEAQQRRLDIVLCLDVSKSMLAEDAGMSRLARAKDDVKQLLETMSGGMVGLVAFSGNADLICPLTDDYDFLRLILEDAGPHSVMKGGTEIGPAIATAVKTFETEGLQHRAIIILTDGEDHGAAAVEQAKAAQEKGIVVYALGYGDSEHGSLVPVLRDGQITYLKHEGQQVWSKLDPTTLRHIAEAGGGEYHPSGQVTATQRTLEWLYADKLAPREERTMENRMVRRQYARAHWLTGLALILLIVEMLIPERRRVSQVNY